MDKLDWVVRAGSLRTSARPRARAAGWAALTLPTVASQGGRPAQFPSPKLHERKSWRGFIRLLCQNFSLQPHLAGTLVLLPLL